MKISSYVVQAQAQRNYVSITSATTTYQQAPPKPQPAETEENATEVSLSDQVQKYLEDAKQQQKRMLEQTKALSSAKPIQFGRKPRNPAEVKIDFLEMMFSHLTGKKFKFRYFEPDFSGGGSRIDMPVLSGGGGQAQAPRMLTTLETEVFHYESETVDYSAQGIIHTADGKTISVDVNMHMSRQFASYTKYAVSTAVCDPLVINYAGTAASLSGETFDFDLNFDGTMDNIHFAGEGSGFLALDKNGDGKINDGQELFGPSSGSGFSELRAYDGDGNGWIDENDEVFNNLLVWSKDKDGNDQLFRLSELDIGAIYLGDVETQFSMNDENNETAGVMRSTSFFLKENGGAGLISHIDLSL